MRCLARALSARATLGEREGPAEEKGSDEGRLKYIYIYILCFHYIIYIMKTRGGLVRKVRLRGLGFLTLWLGGVTSIPLLSTLTCVGLLAKGKARLLAKVTPVRPH